MPKPPQVPGRKVVRALEKAAWYVHRTSGSHVIMKNDAKPGARVVVPVHSRPVKSHTLSAILKAAGLSVEELSELL